MSQASYQVERTDSRDWVQPRSSTARGLAIQRKEKLVLTRTFKWIERLIYQALSHEHQYCWRKIPIALKIPASRSKHVIACFRHSSALGFSPGSLTTRVTNVTEASPTFPVTCQHPSVGKITSLASNPVPLLPILERNGGAARRQAACPVS